MASDGKIEQRLFVPALRPLFRAIAPYNDLFLRLVLGLGFFAHGWGKLLDPAGVADFLGQEGYMWPTLMAWLLILTESLGGMLIALGLFVRPAAVAAMTFMLVAIFIQKWDNGFFYYAGGYELDIVYFFIAFKLFAQGAGRFSLDERLSKTF